MQAAVVVSAQIVLYKVGTGLCLPTCIILGSFGFNIIIFKQLLILSFFLSSCAVECKAWEILCRLELYK
jgi:hypothetical protein